MYSGCGNADVGCESAVGEVGGRGEVRVGGGVGGEAAGAVVCVVGGAGGAGGEEAGIAGGAEAEAGGGGYGGGARVPMRVGRPTISWLWWMEMLVSDFEVFGFLGLERSKGRRGKGGKVPYADGVGSRTPPGAEGAEVGEADAAVGDGYVDVGFFPGFGGEGTPG